MTLLEASVYIAVFAVVGAPILFMTVNASRATKETDVVSRATERNRVSLQRISSEFRRSIAGTASIDPFGKILTFTRSAGFDGSAATAGDVISYALQDDPGDPSNGLDDNDDGLVDEVVLVRINHSTGDQGTVATNLDYFGSGFTRSGNGVTVTITTAGPTGYGGQPTTVTQTIRLFARN